MKPRVTAILVALPVLVGRETTKKTRWLGVHEVLPPNMERDAD